EDTPELQIMERRILTTLGIQVSVANNGKEAVEMALGQRFDLILMDMQMPEMDGIEATALLRQAGYEQPIIALTGNVMQKHQQQFAEAGCDGFLAKPIDRQLLIQLLGQYLPQHTEKERTAVTTALSSSGESLIDDDLRELFVERLTELNSQLRSASNEGRWVEVNQYAHTIKGSGSSFGHPELTQLAAAVCSLLDSGEVGVAAERNEQLLTEMARVITLYP
ncbi:MAG: response regulator, partial [Gammaproteobacteria bacterium]|nr:response regulator [Gammaproteobacteria bacterium]